MTSLYAIAKLKSGWTAFVEVAGHPADADRAAYRYPSKKAAEAVVEKWHRQNAAWDAQVAERRQTRLRIVHEYLARRAARPVAHQFTLEF